MLRIKSQICEKTAQYGECSTNSACGCFHVIGANNNTGIYGFRWLACSHLVLCKSSDNSCSQSDTICVRHPQCNNLPVCYPVTMTDQSICPPMKNKINLKWKQNAITVAGGNGYGQQLNQLYRPTGIFIDEKKNIFVADYLNHRIVEWKCNAKQGQITAGGNGYGNRIDQKNEVRRWKMGEYNNEGIVVAGGNGEGDQLNQLNFPTFMFVDEDQSVYVSDSFNHRVMKWRKDAKEGIVVAGGNGKGGDLNQFCYPDGVIVDDLGQIYVADQWNHRVMRWCEGKNEGEIVVGGNGRGDQLNQLDNPNGLSSDDEGNLYVVDYDNNRVQKFEIIL
ncbi:unnamed protein product [Adineta steineri]|uniref:NHL repeat containing protein n=1 Tax=Adineta steineri TaxID=433720 RepID=A0A818IIB6_9BILA|nr:unnamed protein product [Adineta steineri]